MEILRRIGDHWFELGQTVGTIGALLLGVHANWRDERARKISNLIALKQQHREIWNEAYHRPGLARILEKKVDLKQRPISDEESLFVKLLLLHLDTVHRAAKAGMFVKLKGIQKDIADAFASPILQKVWTDIKSYQDDEFVAFIDDCLSPR